MPAKTILTVLFLISLGVMAIISLHALPQQVNANTTGTADEILVAATTLPPGTLLRAKDVVWQSTSNVEPSQILRPRGAVGNTNVEIDQQSRGEVYGAALRAGVTAGEPIWRTAIVKPSDREFLQVVLSPGARAIAIPVATGGASTGLLYPGDRVDVVLTQKFTDTAAPLTRRSVSETVVENLRVLVIDAVDAKTASGSTFGRTVTLEVTPEQAEKVNVAAELGKLSLTLRSVTTPEGVLTTSTTGPGRATGVKPTWAGAVSPALGGALPDRVTAAPRPPVDIIRGKGVETRKTE